MGCGPSITFARIICWGVKAGLSVEDAEGRAIETMGLAPMESDLGLYERMVLLRDACVEELINRGYSEAQARHEAGICMGPVLDALNGRVGWAIMWVTASLTVLLMVLVWWGLR